MWRVIYNQNGVEQESQVGEEYIDLKQELTELSAKGLNTGEMKIYYGCEEVLTYTEALELCDINL